MAEIAELTETALANQALSLVRIKAINSLAEDTGYNAAVLRKWFAPTRDALLRKHYWNFAKWKKKIGALADPVPEFDWAAFFALPEDCLAVQTVNGCDDDEWEIIGRYIATDAESPIEVTYTRRVVEVPQWDASFRALFVTSLAAAIAPELATDERILDQIEQAAQRAEADAAPPDSAEGTPENLSDSDFSFLRARM
jgi:hypothetical protein